jgi:hypothetical protein
MQLDEDGARTTRAVLAAGHADLAAYLAAILRSAFEQARFNLLAEGHQRARRPAIVPVIVLPGIDRGTGEGLAGECHVEQRETTMSTNHGVKLTGPRPAHRRDLVTRPWEETTSGRCGGATRTPD